MSINCKTLIPFSNQTLKTGKFFFVVLLFTLLKNVSAQESSFSFTAYLEYLNNTWIPSGEIYKSLGINDWQSQSKIYNRVNLSYNPTNNIAVKVGLRNIFDFGPTIETYNNIFKFYGINYDKFATFDNGLFDLTFKISDGNSYMLYSNFDRLNVSLTLNKFEITLGRQRINWSINTVWNPNDIFNTYNYFNFNYIEKPGSDAILLQLFTGNFSSIQLAAKMGTIQKISDSTGIKEEKKLTAAALYSFNKWNYDFQIFGGVMEDDVTAGFGWSGAIGGAGFTGEVSCFHSKHNFSNNKNVWVASSAINYTFQNSIFINFSFIYNSAGKTGLANDGFGISGISITNSFQRNLNAKNLTLSRLDIFGQVSYPITALINLDFATIYNPWDESGYAGPSVSFSLTENITLKTIGQLFWGKSLAEYGDIGQMYFLDLKWTF
jgi:hypothetical protein